MKKGNKIVEQVSSDGFINYDYDQSLSPTEIFELIKRYFPKIKKMSIDQRVFIGEYNGKKFAIRCKNVTYLGNPHPAFKKRIQISDDLYSFNNLALSINAVPLLLGIYSYKDNFIFVSFKIDTYLTKAAHNSSAHIYVNDIVNATLDGYFQKIDYFNNTVTAFRPDIISTFLDEELNIISDIQTDDIVVNESLSQYTSGINRNIINQSPLYSNVVHTETNTTKETTLPIPSQEKPKTQDNLSSSPYNFSDNISPLIINFFYSLNKELNGIDCYKKMIKDGYRNRFQAEWLGFYLEYEFERYLVENNLVESIVYAQDKSQEGIDLDLFFPKLNSFGDLKAHSEDSRSIQGNDWDTIIDLICNNNNGHVYYIVCDHYTEKDSLHDYEVTRFWNSEQNKTDLMSYSSRMKHSVKLTRLYILDINSSNKIYLTKYKQGVNSNGKPRAPKIMIEHDNLKHFIIDEALL